MSEKCHSILRAHNGLRAADVASVVSDLKHGQILPEHFHPEEQLIFASQGVMTVHTRDAIWVVPPLRAVWIPAHTPHSVSMSGAVSMRTLYLRSTLSDTFPKRCLVMNVSPLLRELILHACSFSRLTRRSASQRRVIDLLLDQFETVDSVPLQLPHPSDQRALRVVRALYADPSDTRDLATLARDCGASKRTIERLFALETRMTFGRWRQQFRLLRSMQLLASGEKVTAAALEAGYNSPSAFISMFRKQLGTTPTRYFVTHRPSLESEG
jgi:AraC-like DNA-binding protein/quercetin dioxygenase-like cupin family protein